MLCRCGREFKEGEQTCASCGTKLEELTPPSVSTPKKHTKRFKIIVCILVVIGLIIIYRIGRDIKGLSAFKENDFNNFVKELNCGGAPCLKEGSYELEKKDWDIEHGKIQKHYKYRIKNSDYSFEVMTITSCVDSFEHLCIDSTSCICKKWGYKLYTDYFHEIKYYIDKEYDEKHPNDTIEHSFNRYKVNNKSDLETVIQIIKDYKDYLDNLDYKLSGKIITVYFDNKISYKEIKVGMENNGGKYEYDFNKDDPNMTIREYLEESMNNYSIELPY